MVSLHIKFEFLLFLLLFGNIKIANSTWQTQKVFPLVFGAGTWDMQIYDLALDSSYNIGIVGTSKQSKSTGEGFYIFMDSYGKVIYQKQYISTYNSGDEIRFLQYYWDMPYLMGLWKDSTANIPFLLILNIDGSVYFHYKGGQFGSTFPKNAALSSFQVITVVSVDLRQHPQTLDIICLIIICMQVLL